jgi:tetratricopeptide (TPR) repeat protein
MGSAAHGRELGTWCVSTTDRFQLISDLDRDAQRQLLELLTRFDPVAEPFLPGDAVARPAPLKLVVFSRRADFQNLTGKRKFAGFMQPSLETARLLIGPLRGDLTETTLHEYAHYRLRNRLDISLPTWFDEGLASLLGSVDLTDADAVVGRLPTRRMENLVSRELGSGPSAGFDAALTATSVARWSVEKINAFYDWSWLLVHYLYLGQAGDPLEQSRTLTSYLRAGDTALPDYLGFEQRQLVRALERHLRRPPSLKIPIDQAAPATAAFECMDDLERDHELARAILTQNPSMASRLLRPYAKSHSNDVAFLVTRARIAVAMDELDAATALAEDALEQGPEAPEAMVLNADLAARDCLFTVSEQCYDHWRRARALYRKTVRIDPERNDAVIGLGLAYLYTGRPGEAVNYLKVAYAKAPWAALTNYYLGESYRLIGDTRAAIYLTNARNWADLPVWERLAEESLRLLGGDSGSEIR